MDLSRLSAEEKRLRDWQHFLQSEKGIASDVKNTFTEKLKSFRNLLERIWEKNEVSPEDNNNLADLRRQLTQLMDEARLSAR